MADENNSQNKDPLTNEQTGFISDYLFNKFMDNMMDEKEKRNRLYRKESLLFDSEGNLLVEPSMSGNLNKAESNMLMSLLDDGIKNTKREGIMAPKVIQIDDKFYKMEGDKMVPIKRETEMLMANDRIIQLDSLVDPDMDPGDLRTIYDEMMKESGGNYPGVSFDDFLKNIGTRPRTASEGGIMFLEPGGEVKKGYRKGSVRIPSTYGNKSFEDFLKDIGFTKVDENTGKVRGSKGEWNKFLKSKGIKVGSPAATNLLNTMLKDAGKMPYISVDMSEKGLGQALVDEITDTEAGKPNVKEIRSSAINKIEEIRVDANEKFGRNPTKKKYAYIKDQVVKFFPKVAGTTALLNFIAGRALGAVSAFLPTEMGDATLYDSEGNLKEGMGLEEANEGILQAVKENQPTEEQEAKFPLGILLKEQGD